MTLPENVENNKSEDVHQSKTIETFDEDIEDIKHEKLKSEKNVITGAYSCAKFLNSNPEDVNLCLLTDSGTVGDVTLHIEHTLIEAFCYENKIPVVKGQPAMYMLEKEYLSEMEENTKLKNDDLSCVLILFSKETQKEEYEKLEKGDFQDNVFYDVSDNRSIKYPA